MATKLPETRSLALTPTWSVAAVLTILVAVSLLVERAIHRLSSVKKTVCLIYSFFISFEVWQLVSWTGERIYMWLKKTHRNPLFEALEKMKEELMLLGFISLLLTATSRTISNICIDSKFYNSNFSPCTVPEVEDTIDTENSPPKDHNLVGIIVHHLSFKRTLSELHSVTCSEGHEPFVSYEGLEQLHKFIFVMAITHLSYSCLTMLLAIVKIHTWRVWEEEARRDQHDTYGEEITRALTMRRQSSFMKSESSYSWSSNSFVIWVTCFFRQFGQSIVRADYLTLRWGFILNHNLTSKYDFHSYMIRSMEEEFKRIVGVSAPLWGFVVAFMLFNIKGSNLYFWIAIIPITHVIATLALESAGVRGFGGRLKPRDELFWFKKPELLLSLIHFILFQNAFELASFFWFWWQFGYDSCFIRNHFLVYCRLVLGFAGQFLCSYSTLPLYALVTQMGTNYKAALIPQRIRDTIHGWGKAAKKRRKHRRGIDESTIHTETSTVCSIDEEGPEFLEDPSNDSFMQIELQPSSTAIHGDHRTDGSVDLNYNSAHASLLRSISVRSSPSPSARGHGISRCASMPIWRSPPDA